MDSSEPIFNLPPFDPPRWIPWEELFDSPPLSARNRGAYVVAYSPIHQPQSPPSPSANEVVYIGETHGEFSSLLSRLGQFGNSAGLRSTSDGASKGQQPGHYAAWRFLEVAERLNKERYRVGHTLSAADVYVGLVPVPETEDWVRAHVDAPGILPGLYESMLLWAHVRTHHQQPALNNSGKQSATRETAEEAIKRSISGPAAPAIEAFLVGTSDDLRLGAAESILQSLAEAWGYAKARVYRDADEGGYCASRTFGPKYWVCLGWNATGSAYASLWLGREQRVAEVPVSSEQSLRASLSSLLRQMLTRPD